MADKFDMVKDSLKITRGLPYQDAVKLSFQVKTGEEYRLIQNRDQVKNGVRTLTVFVQRNSGRSWRTIPRKVELVLDYTEKRYSPVTRVPQVRGLREAALAMAEELWDSFKPTPDQIELMTTGGFRKNISAKTYEHGEGRTVLVELSGLPYGDVTLSSREFRVFVDVDPYVDTVDDVRAEVRNSVFYNPVESEVENFGNNRHVSEGLNSQIVEYIKPLLIHVTEKLGRPLAQQRKKYLDNQHKEAAELIEHLTNDLRKAKQALVVREKEATNFTARIEAKRKG